jgi:hypothetical protein
MASTSTSTSTTDPGKESWDKFLELFFWEGKSTTFESKKEDAARAIKAIVGAEDLEVQRKAYTPLMKRPFPAATDCSQGRPGWALFYLPAVQTIDQNIYATFNNMITHSDIDDPQDFPIYAPLQVSGAGKTKLCYTLAMDVGAIVIRFVRYTSNTDTPIYTIIACAWENDDPTLLKIGCIFSKELRRW